MGFFLVLGVSLLIYPFAPLAPSSFSGIIAELANFLTLISFAFALRAFIRFQGISAISPNVITVVVTVLAVAKFIIGTMFLPAPVMKDYVIYWHYPQPNYAFYITLLFLFTIAMAITLFSNIGNASRHQQSIFFLGLGFLAGGAGGVLTVGSNTFEVLVVAYFLLLCTAVFISLFITGLLRKEGIKNN